MCILLLVNCTANKEKKARESDFNVMSIEEAEKKADTVMAFTFPSKFYIKI